MNITVYAYLNNYQMGSYAHSCMSPYIVKEERINRYTTKVTWTLPREKTRLLQKAIGYKKLVGDR